MTHIPFSPDLLSKGYKLSYRNGERPEDYKVWYSGDISTYTNGKIVIHSPSGKSINPDYDLFLTPPEMYVAVYDDDDMGVLCTSPYGDLNELKGNYPGYDYYRLVPVEEEK